MKALQIRQAFFDFFTQKRHTLMPAAPLVNQNDPTLMFINSGMAPFKDYFLGQKASPHVRMVDSQHCLRVSGKHNDLEEVGHDTYHHTLFEMLGNWSIGDYFKPEAIAWAWELLTEVYRIPKGQIYVTYFAGDDADGLMADEETRQLWCSYLSTDHILPGNKKDNFWEMGTTGPCGPSSELHVDIRSAEERKQQPGAQLVNQDHPHVIEVWNLVFMQFNRLANGKLEPLPQQHVDTGMGFERLAMVLQGKKATYDTDIFAPLLQAITQKTGVVYGAKECTDVAMRVIVDHIRAVACAIAEGQLPSNQQAGYVVRRILRRAIRYAYSGLGLKAPFLHTLVPLVAQQLGPVVPALVAQASFVATIVQAEEKAFLHTLSQGLQRLAHLMQEGKTNLLAGEAVFELYDTYGFPHDLTALIAQEHGKRIDEEGFQQALVQQKQRAKQATALIQGDWQVLRPLQQVKFVGYDRFEATARLMRYRQVTHKGKTHYQLVFDQTPFYPEGGGQVGDTGYLKVGDQQIHVIDTQKENGLIVHLTTLLPNTLQAEIRAHVDAIRRLAITNHHTATHLLHKALQETLGVHVTQKGSLVNEKLLRFDFAHSQPLTSQELATITQRVNENIRANWVLEEVRDIPLEAAKARGAMALFGEKYDEKVRMVAFGQGYTVELCGGTHAAATGQLGLFLITSTTAVAAGVRRLEAVADAPALMHLMQQQAQWTAVQRLLQQPKDVPKALERLLTKQATLQQEVAQYEQQQVQQALSTLRHQLPQREPYIIVERVQVGQPEALRQLAFDLKHSQPNMLFVLLGAVIKGRPYLAALVTEDLHTKLQGDARTVIQQLAPHIEGGGGGQAFFATAGGKRPQGLDDALQEALTWVQKLLKD